MDKRALAQGPAAIDAELARVRPLVEEGGYVAGVDHGLPPDVSFAHYCYYMERLQHLVDGLNALDRRPEPPIWSSPESPRTLHLPHDPLQQPLR